MELEINGWLLDVESGDGWKNVGFVEDEQLNFRKLHNQYIDFHFYCDNVEELTNNNGKKLKLYRIKEQLIIEKWIPKGNYIYALDPRKNITSIQTNEVT